MRKPGWYWVKWENPGDPPSWCPSWWCEDAHAWWVEECYQEEDDIVEIGPRIPTPDEPWQCVPVEPTAAMMRALWQAEPLDRYAAMLTAAPRP